MDQIMEDAVHVIQYEIVVQEGDLGQVGPDVQVTERSWLFDPDTFDVVEVPPLPDYIDNSWHQQQGGIDLDELEVSAIEAPPLAHSSPTSPPCPIAGFDPLAASSPQSPCEGFNPLAASSPESPCEGFNPLAASSPESPPAQHDATFNACQGQDDLGLNNTFVIEEDWEMAHGLNETYDVPNVCYDLVPGLQPDVGPGPNDDWNIPPEPPQLYDAYDEVPEPNVVYDLVPGLDPYEEPGLNVTCDVVPGQAAPGPDNPFVIEEDWEMAHELNETYNVPNVCYDLVPGLQPDVGPGPNDDWNIPPEPPQLYDAYDEVPEPNVVPDCDEQGLNNTFVIADEFDMAPGLNVTYDVPNVCYDLVPGLQPDVGPGPNDDWNIPPEPPQLYDAYDEVPEPNIVPDCDEQGLNNTFVIADEFDMAPGLNVTYDVPPEPNVCYDLVPGLQPDVAHIPYHDWEGAPQPPQLYEAYDEVYEAYDEVYEACDEAYEAYDEVPDPNVVPECDEPGLNNTFVIADELEVAPGLNATWP